MVEKGEGGINVLAILVPAIEALTLLVILVGRRGRKKDKKSSLEDGEFDKLQLLFMYTLPMMIVMYPIADKIHFLIGTYIASILMIYELYMSINIITKNKEKLIPNDILNLTHIHIKKITNRINRKLF